MVYPFIQRRGVQEMNCALKNGKAAVIGGVLVEQVKNITQSATCNSEYLRRI